MRKGSFRKGWAGWAGVALALFLAGPRLAGAADKVTFLLDWTPYGKHAFIFAGLDQGFYAQEGLEVSVQRGTGSADTIKNVGAGLGQFGHADAASLVISRAKGIKVKIAGMFHHKSLHALYTLKSSGIRQPKDLAGKSIGTSPGNASWVVLPALAAITGFDMKSVKPVFMAPPSMEPSLFSGKVDAIVTFATFGPVYDLAAKKTGKGYLEVLYSDHGVDVYSNGLITTDRVLQENPDLVRRVARGIFHALAWSVEHSDQALQSFLKRFPESSPAVAKGQWEVNLRHLLTAETKKFGIGYMVPERMKYTRDTIVKFYGVKEPVTAEELYTNDFMNGLPREWRFPKAP